MKKRFTVILALSVALVMTACGKDEPVDYYKLLEDESSTYYYEAEMSEQFIDEEDSEPVKSVMAEGRDGKDKHVIFEGEKELEARQLEIADTMYAISDTDKEYIKSKIEEEEEMEEEEIELVHTGSAQMEIDGKTYKYDEYQDEYEMEGYGEDGEAVAAETYLYIKRYLYDQSGKLYALMYLNELKGVDGEENQLIYQRTDTITKLQAGEVPQGIFDIPKDYQEITEEDDTDDEYGDEALIEEE